MKTKILVAPLNWGIGHATRCIPIINALLDQEFEPVIACDGQALLLLKKEFPKLLFTELAAYNIRYSKKGHNLKWCLFKQIPKIKKAIKQENKQLDQLIKQYNLKGVISDNRMGLYSKKIPTVYITHQLQILSGKTSWISSKMHSHYIRNFDVCWIPDYESKPHLSGVLGHPIKQEKTIPINYIGPLSRLKYNDGPLLYDFLILLSGPEPQRSLLEKKLLKEFRGYNGPILIVRGIVESEQIINTR